MKKTISALAAAGVLALASIQPAAAATGDWPQQGGSARHASRISSPGNLAPTTVRSLALELSARTTAQPGLAVVGGVAYGEDDSGRVLALSTSTGRQLWSQTTCDGQQHPYTLAGDWAPAVGGGRLWVNSATHLTGIDLRTHAVVACVPLGAGGDGAGSPTFYGGAVFLANGSRVYSVDASIGRVRWTATLASGFANGTVAVDGGLVLVPSASYVDGSGHVYALRASNGSRAWTYSSPGVVVAVTAWGGRVFASDPPTGLDEATGRVLWTRTGYLPGAGLSVDGSRVYVYCGEASTAPPPAGGTCDGEVLAFDAATGRLLWHHDVASEGAGDVTVGNGVVYVTDPVDLGRLTMLRATTGAMIATRAHPGGFLTSQPVVVDGKVYLLGLLETGAGFLDRWGA
jgi:hypothetical protein